MNLKFWQKSEHRSSDYTATILEAAISAAQGQGNSGEAAKVAAVVFGVGLLSRGFATAKITPEVEALDPETLARIARSLLLRGNYLAAINVSRIDGLTLIPTTTWDIEGGLRPATWRYALDMPTPGGRTITRHVGAAGVVHARINSSLSQPWVGLSPLTEAGLSAALLGNLEKRLGEEANVRSGYLLPIPEGLSEPSQTKLRSDLATLNGQIKVVETTSGGYGAGRGQAPLADWKTQRLGADFPQFNVELRKDAGNDVLAALGVPSALMSGEGAASREAWRHTIVTSLVPMAKFVAAELSIKLEQTISITFPSLVATDIAARARAYNSLIQAEMDPGKAEMLTGLNGA